MPDLKISELTTDVSLTGTEQVPINDGGTTKQTTVADIAAVGQIVLSVTVTLTDAQIKALPTTPVTVLAAQGVGTLIVPIFGYAVSEFSANDYTNVDQHAYMKLLWGLVDASGRSWIGNAIWFDAWGGAGQGKVYGPFQVPELNLHVEGANTRIVADTGFQNIANEPLRVIVNNGSAGNFTGGNAANTLKVTALYRVIDL